VLRNKNPTMEVNIWSLIPITLGKIDTPIHHSSRRCDKGTKKVKQTKNILLPLLGNK
jgi:hypothetical protein